MATLIIPATIYYDVYYINLQNKYEPFHKTIVNYRICIGSVVVDSLFSVAPIVWLCV